MRETFEHDYPPAEWDGTDIARALRTADGPPVLPTFADVESWAAFQSDPLTGPAVADLLDRASAAREEPLPVQTASMYLEFDRTGDRSAYQAPNRLLRNRLGWFTLAECIEREGRYRDPALDYAWAICEQTSWVIPAHLRDPQATEGLPGVVDPEQRTVALRSAETAQLLAEVDHVLGDELHPAVGERIRTEVDRRVFAPYEARDDHKWMQLPCNNWNAVCNGAIATAALYLLDDRDRVGTILEKAIDSLADYLGSFDPEGCTPEGMNYWNYGMAHYVFLAAELESRTAGELSLVSPPILEHIADFPVNAELSPGVPVPFSDAFLAERVVPHAAAWLGTRVNNDALVARARDAMRHERVDRDLREPVRNWCWTAGMDPEGSVPSPPSRVYYPTSAWWIARNDPSDPDGLVVAAKGGHNAESHNHNDLGSFVVHVGGETLLADLGMPQYDRDYFSAPRYEYLTARALGHSIPFVNDTEQVDGREYEAAVTDVTETATGQRFAVDLTEGYPKAAGLDSLTRTVELHAGTPGHVTVTDEAGFASPENRFESVLVSYRPISAANGRLRVEGDAAHASIEIDRPVDPNIERLDGAVRDNDVWRARLDLGDVGSEVAYTLTIHPELLEHA